MDMPDNHERSRDLADALEGVARTEWIASKPGGFEALQAYEDEKRVHDGNAPDTVRSMLRSEEGRDALATMGELWIEYDADMSAISPPVSMPPPLRPEDR